MRLSCAAVVLFVLSLCCRVAPTAGFESFKDKLRAEAETNKMPDSVKNTIKGMHASGLPREEIAKKLKYASDTVPNHKLVDGVLDKKKDVDIKTKLASNKKAQKLKQNIRNAKRKNKKDLRNARKNRDEF